MSKSTEELGEEVESVLMHFAELAVVGDPEKELLRAKVMVLELFDQELAKRVEEALISTGLYLRCDFCGQVKEAGKSRHTYDSEGKPIEHICNDCVNATLNNQEKK